MVDLMHCPKCGSTVSGGSDVCHACGHVFDSEVEFEREVVRSTDRYLTIAAAIIAIGILLYLLLR